MARRYYIDRYSDEVVPCDCTLEGWAAWLAKGGNRGEAGRGEDDWWSFDPPAHGTEYVASVLRFAPDVTATRDADDGLTFEPPLPEGIDFAAVRFGPGLGWDCDSILNPEEITDGLLGYPAEPFGGYPLLEPSESACIAIGFNEPDVRLRFELAEGGTPRLIVAGTVQ